MLSCNPSLLTKALPKTPKNPCVFCNLAMHYYNLYPSDIFIKFISSTRGNVMSIIFDAYLIFIIPALITLVGVAIWEQLS
jgi:hypothetical protein